MDRPSGEQMRLELPCGSKMMAVELKTKPVLQVGTSRPLFQTDMVETGIRTGPMSWGLAPDGNRFLIISETSSDAFSLNVDCPMICTS